MSARQKPFSRRVYALLTALVWVTGLSATEQSLTPQVDITIPAGDLEAALKALVRLTGVKLICDTKILLTGLHTRGVKRARTLAAALGGLLKGTPFSVTPEPDGAFLIDERQSTAGKSEMAPPVQASRGDPERPAEPSQVVITAPRVWVVGASGQDVTRDELLATGGGAVSDILGAMTWTFGGGPNQDTSIGFEAQSNAGLGTGMNLRGLGARETLVLIDGRRVAPSGSDAEFTDTLNIPVTAIRTINVIPYDATARYGADAVAGVVNFELLKEFSGMDTVVSGGGGTRADLTESLFAQTMGRNWDSGNGVLSFELWRRGSLPAVDRSYAVSDLYPFGGGNFDSLQTNPGNIIDARGQIWAIPAGQDGRRLMAAQLVAGTSNQQNNYDGAQIIPSQERRSLYATGRQDLDEETSVFTDILTAHRQATEAYGGAEGDLLVPASNPFYVNPTGIPGPVTVAYNFLKDLGPSMTRVDVNTLNATVGLDFHVGTQWTVEAYANYSREREHRFDSGEVDSAALYSVLADPNPVTAFNPFGDGSNTNAATLDAIRANYQLSLDSSLWVLDISAAGPLVNLPGGALGLVTGAALRKQLFSTNETLTTTGTSTGAGGSRSVSSMFEECTLPVIGSENRLPGMSKLEASVAVRYERYSDVGDSGTPKFGLIAAPFTQLALRGTWAISERPPTLGDIDVDRAEATSVVLPNPQVPGGATQALVLEGGNPSAKNERAKSWTAGMDFASVEVPGLTAAVTYFSTTFRDRLQQGAFTASILSDPNYSAMVTRNPSTVLIADLCSHTIYVQGTVTQCENVGAGAIVDLRLRNLATTLTHGIDFMEAYHVASRYGDFDVALEGTWIMQFAQTQIPGEPLVSLLDTQNNPVDLRLRPAVSWKFAGFRALLAANFTDRYWDTASVPERRISAWTTVDLQLSYEPLATDNRWLRGIRLQLNAQNVFNVDPPFLNNQIVGIGYDQENANPYGRVVRVQVAKGW